MGDTCTVAFYVRLFILSCILTSSPWCSSGGSHLLADWISNGVASRAEQVKSTFKCSTTGDERGGRTCAEQTAVPGRWILEAGSLDGGQRLGRSLWKELESPLMISRS
ncbi:uncharacterized protein LOC132405126 isoform X3 [Hypanus sabinus]|uniref:uncharacterized protein LOC132405126 isoform X3 n=1 Tax=Hypanus sabinus TaxID=79690 RepID=UPI0028C37771|nr:uncharacterized protein LOC132405126 isoform X3 [Hypanus sabinus]